MFHKLSNRMHELSYFTYLAAKLKYWKQKDETDGIDSEVMLEGIELMNGQLMANGKSILE